MGRDDVRHVAAVAHDAVHLVTGGEVLAQQADGDLGNGEHVAHVDAAFGRGGRVRLLAGVANREVRHRADSRRHVLERCRVHHHRRVHTVERAAFEEEDLAAAAFLRGRTDHADGEAEIVDEWCEREAGADGHRRDDVVPARVPDLRERVVLRADREVQRSVAEPARERRG